VSFQPDIGQAMGAITLPEHTAKHDKAQAKYLARQEAEFRRQQARASAHVEFERELTREEADFQAHQQRALAAFQQQQALQRAQANSGQPSVQAPSGQHLNLSHSAATFNQSAGLPWSGGATSAVSDRFGGR